MNINWSAPNIENNYTPISYEIYIQNNNVRFNSNGWTISFKIDGVPIYYLEGQHIATNDIGFYDAKLIASGTANIYHEIDGSKTIQVLAELSKSGYSSYDPGYCRAEGPIVLPNIPREATLLSSGDITVIGLETSQHLQFSNPANRSLSLQYIVGNNNFSKDIGTTTDKTITFTQEEIEKLLQSDQYTLKVITQGVGEKQSNWTITRKGILHTNNGILVPYCRTNNNLKLCTAYYGKKEGV